MLPNFTSHSVHGISRPFDHYFDAEKFSRAMKAIGLFTWWADHPPPQVKTMKLHRSKTHLDGWFKYKNGGADNVVDDVLQALRPAAHLRQRVAAVQAGALANRSYGCMHPRIERDMQKKGWVFNKGGQPPTLAHTLAAMADNSAIRSATRVFVAVGTEIPELETKVLMRPSSWGAKFVRSRKEGRVLPTMWNKQDEDYTQTSIVDLEICRGAAWLVGWPGSSFSRVLGFYHIRTHRGWYTSCRERRSLQFTDDWFTHGCAPQNKSAPATKVYLISNSIRQQEGRTDSTISEAMPPLDQQLSPADAMISGEPRTRRCSDRPNSPRLPSSRRT